MCGKRYEVNIFDPAEESETIESGNIRVLTTMRCRLPPRTERLVKCRTDRAMVGGKDYIFEPARGDDDRFPTPIHFIHRSGKSPELSIADYLSRVSHESFADDEISHGSICKTNLKQLEELPARMGIECIKTEQRNHFPELLDAFETDDAKANALKMVPDDTIHVKVLDRVSMDSRGLMVMTFN